MWRAHGGPSLYTREQPLSADSRPFYLHARETQFPCADLSFNSLLTLYFLSCVQNALSAGRVVLAQLVWLAQHLPFKLLDHTPFRRRSTPGRDPWANVTLRRARTCLPAEVKVLLSEAGFNFESLACVVAGSDELLDVDRTDALQMFGWR